MTTSHEEDRFAELVRLRRMFHQQPETGFTEFWTTARICEYLAKLNCTLVYGKALKGALTEPGLLDPHIHQNAYDRYLEKHADDPWIPKLAGVTGAVAIFKGKREGPVMGLRFDIDGLPIEESQEKTHRPFAEEFASTNGNMHACGHDGHITMGLGLAKTLSDNIHTLSGQYFLIFQPAEEVIMGGKIFSTLNFIKDLKYFFAVHLGMSGPEMVTCGVSFFADKRFRIVFKGKGAHAGGTPQAGKNALMAACTAVSGLYGISRHSGGDSRINVGAFTCPNAVNIIPDHAEFELDLRSQTNPVMDYLVNQAQNIVQGAALMQDVTCETLFVTESAVAENSGPMIAQTRKACMDMGMQPTRVIDRLQVSGSEDATFIMNEVLKNGGQTTFVGLGSPTAGSHHNGNFDINEKDLLMGVNLLYQLIRNLSNGK